MASRALMARFRTAFSTWLGSTSVFHNPPAITVSTWIFSPRVRRSMSLMSRITRPRSTELGSSAWRRAKASSWPVRREPRATAPMAFCSRSRRRGSACTSAPGHRQIEIGADDLQQVVEVVRHAAGEMADRFHLLGLAHHGLGAQPGGDVQHPDQEAAGGDGGLVDVQFAVGPDDMLGIGAGLFGPAG